MWIQVNVDGSALRCRFFEEESALVVQGVVESAKAIKWKSALGTEEVEFRGDSLAVKASYGTAATFEPAEELMPPLCKAQPPSSESNAAVGLWRIPGSWVWIRINSDGSAVHCRMPGPAATVLVKGVLETPRSIKWANDWGTWQLDTGGGSLRIKGSVGEVTFEPAEVPMPPQCRREAGG